MSLLFIAPIGKAEELMVAVASNFSLPMRQIAEVFAQTHPHTVQLSFGSSGKFFAQIVNGAPYDLFFSADQSKPQALIDKELAITNSRFTYALGALALWSADPHKITTSNNILLTDNFNKLALANPKLAPYGLAAMDVLSNMQLLETTRERWVQGENIAQTYQFIASHNADIGFVAVSQIMQKGKLTSGSAWFISATLYRPIKQDTVILKRVKNIGAANEFMSFMQGPEASNIIQSFGYTLEQN
ncbi:molybdate ABC transporter substrate-binding protein [Paraglaciecola sp.]|uniref:molybdate ABC transporter substrate-binding protein n=1 Tax=Paraglaciecola sp. TaxID=1920173 RepID=UPI0030F405BA